MHSLASLRVAVFRRSFNCWVYERSASELARRVCLALQGELSLESDEDGGGGGEHSVNWRLLVSGICELGGCDIWMFMKT